MRNIKKVAVLGSGIMGSSIACHLANAGLEVILLDRVDEAFVESTDQKDRNRIVNHSLQATIKSKPAPLYDKTFKSRIQTGNFEDHMYMIKNCDWVIEVIIENLEIKKNLLSKVIPHLNSNAILSSNTSGIPIHKIIEDATEDIKSRFLGTHFFNPPRYLALLEIIPTADTKEDVTEFVLNFGRNRLGKDAILAKDTPAFIANRVGVVSMAKIFELTEKYKLPISVVDKLTGSALFRPKTGTFRLGDLVGMDTAVKVIKDLKQALEDDKDVTTLEVSDSIHWLIENRFFGNKTNQGFYKKSKNDKGEKLILELDLENKEYIEKPNLKLDSLNKAKQIEDPNKRLKALLSSDDAGGKLISESLAFLFSYASQRIPEICNSVDAIDRAMKAGFAWKYGPFEYWDLIGFNEGIELIKKYNYEIPEWVRSLENDGAFSSFYNQVDGKLTGFDVKEESHQIIPGQDKTINLRVLSAEKMVFQNEEINLYDIGDGVLCLEFTSKMNTIGGGVLKGLNKAIDIATEEEWKGIVIGNHADNFSVGANLMMIAMMAYQGDFDELNYAVRLFQDTSMRCRYSPIPIVMATQGYVFGGACELLMHCDAAVVAAESYIGLVEVGVGLVPGGGGTKEFALRLSDSLIKGGVDTPQLITHFKTLAMGQVSTSAYEAFNHHYLIKHRDHVTINKSKNIAMAKARVIQLAFNYVPPANKEILVLGKSGLATLYTAANELQKGNFASEHDIKIAHKIATVLCGGELSGKQIISEQYVLDLEREAFLSLCGEQKTLERIQHMLEFNKPLRN